MTLALKMADIEYDAYEEGFDKGRKDGLKTGLQQGIEQGLQQGMQQGRKEGAHETKLETAKNFLSMGFPPEQVAQGTHLPLDVVQKLL